MVSNNMNFEFSETLAKSFDDFDGFDGSKDEIKCYNCGWKWKVKDGGNDLYVCHKCNSDNSKFYSFGGEEKKSNADYSQAITQGVQAIGQIGGAIAQKKATKEANKDDVARYVDLKCGKDKSRALSKKKKSAYTSCKAEAIKSFDVKKQEDSAKSIQQAELTKKVAETKQKAKKTLYIGVAISVLVLGVFIYFKNKHK